MICGERTVMLEKILASLVRIGATTLLVLAFGMMAYAGYAKFRDTGSINMLGVIAVNSVFLVMSATRRDAVSVSTSPALWLIAFGGSFVPLLLRPSQAVLPPQIGTALQLAGGLCIIASLFSLRRSFGVVPANRGIQTRGLYNVVRHPLYASELLALGGFAAANPSLWNVSLWLCECALQFARACAEERLLSEDPSYVQYRSRVKYRLIPMIV
jgi:protein-S-isoprenylcysteine O-methyltransferase Ste14